MSPGEEACPHTESEAGTGLRGELASQHGLPQDGPRGRPWAWGGSCPGTLGQSDTHPGARPGPRELGVLGPAEAMAEPLLCFGLVIRGVEVLGLVQGRDRRISAPLIKQLGTQ